MFGWCATFSARRFECYYSGYERSVKSHFQVQPFTFRPPNTHIITEQIRHCPSIDSRVTNNRTLFLKFRAENSASSDISNLNLGMEESMDYGIKSTLCQTSPELKTNHRSSRTNGNSFEQVFNSHCSRIGINGFSSLAYEGRGNMKTRVQVFAEPLRPKTHACWDGGVQ